MITRRPAGRWRALLIGLPVSLLAALLSLLVIIKVKYGRGDPYPDLRTRPRVPEAQLEAVVELPFPPGNVAVSPGGRVFFNFHPFAKAQRFAPASLFELVDGRARPFPDEAFQSRLQGVFGMTVDRQDRLWVVEPGGLDFPRTRVMAFALATGKVTFETWLPEKTGGFAQDLRVAPDGKTVYLADTGLFRFTPPALLVLDVATARVREVLKGHPALQPQNWVMHTPFGPHRLGFGLVTFTVGLDGLELSRDGAWLYFGAMSHDSLFRVPTAALDRPERVERVGRKPLSDGITLDTKGNAIITDVEHGGLARLAPDGTLETLVTSPRVIWADGVVEEPGGSLVFTDSAIPAYVDQLARPPREDRLAAHRPYHIWRLRPP